MKFHETHFEEYLVANNKVNLHPKLTKIYAKFPISIHDFRNVIFYGPSGTGKYTQMLQSIKKYSPSELKYERKISLIFNKQQYFFKVSDIHYEVDMSLLGCNSKLFWHEIFEHVVDIISAKVTKSGIIVCKYFHEIHGELLENFYSYMQQNLLGVDIKFVLLTEELSFIPDNIVHCCEVIHVARPPKTMYTKCLQHKGYKMPCKVKPETITNTKLLPVFNEDIMLQYKIICNKVVTHLVHTHSLNFLKFRDLLYDLFIYNLDISDCIWYILSSLIEQGWINNSNLPKILIRTYVFFQYYNNNYRPIYHVENFFLYLAKTIHGF